MIILTSSELRRLWSYTNSTYPVIVQPNERAVKRGVAHLVLAVSYCALTVPTVSVSRKDTQSGGALLQPQDERRSLQSGIEWLPLLSLLDCVGSFSRDYRAIATDMED